jgi:hypothetical protein
MHTDLFDRRGLAASLGLDFGIDQRSWRRKLHRSKQIAAKDLKRAVNVIEVDAEKHPDRQIENLRKKPPVERVVPLQSEAGDDVELSNVGREQADIRDVELPVGVHKHDEIAGCGPKSGG